MESYNLKKWLLLKLCPALLFCTNFSIGILFIFACYASYQKSRKEMSKLYRQNISSESYLPLYVAGTSLKYEDRNEFFFPEVAVCIWSNISLDPGLEHNLTHRFAQLQKMNSVIRFDQQFNGGEIITWASSTGVSNYTQTYQALSYIPSQNIDFAICTYYITLQHSHAGFTYQVDKK